MTKNVLAVAAGIATTVLLAGAVGYFELHFTETRQVVGAVGNRPSSGFSDEVADNVFRGLERSLLRSRALYRPLIAMAVGVVVALLAGRGTRLTAAVAMVPFLVIVGDQESWHWIAVPLAVIYLVLGLAAASVVSRMRRTVGSRRE